MASFVNYDATPQAENYSGRSKGTDRAQPNEALGTLFKGLGTVVDTTVKAVDNNNILNINKELETGIDALRGAQGVDAALGDPTITGGETGANVPGGGRTVPPGIDTATSEINRINQAYKEGKIGDTYYYAKVESLARQVRAKYPGYREIIDQKVSSIIGTNPANALRSSILSDLKTAQSTAQARANSAEARIERDREHLTTAEYEEWKKNPNPENTARADLSIQQSMRKSQVIKQQEQQYDLAKKMGTARKEDAQRNAVLHANDIVIKIFNEGIDAVSGGSGATLNQKLMAMAKSGKPPTPEEIGQIRAAFGALRNQAALSVETTLKARRGDNKDWSYESEGIDVNTVRSNAMKPFEEIEKALVNNDFGMFTWYTQQAKILKDGAMQGILERSQTVRDLSAAQELMGPALGQLLIEGNVFPRAASELAKVLNMNSVVKSITGSTSSSNIIRDSVREARTAGNSSSTKEVVNTIVSQTRDILVGKNVPKEGLARYAATWFNPNGNFITDRDTLTESSRQSIIATFTAPDVVKNMSTLKESHPEVWNSYKGWIEASTRSVFNTTIGTLNEWSRPGSGYIVNVDQQGRVSVARDRALPTDAFTAQVDRSIVGMQKSIGQLNSAIDSRRRIAQEEGGNPAETGKQFAQGLGLPITEVKPSGSGNPQQGGGNTVPQPLMSTPDATIEPANLTSDDRDLLIEFERGAGEPIDLEARDIRRRTALYNSDPEWQSGGRTIQDTADLKTGIRQAAQELGIDPIDLATVISYETGGNFSPSIRGGARDASGRGKHIGLIQFGPEEQRMYGASQDQSAGEQMKAVVRYLKHRGFRPGMGILDLYSTINAGQPGRYGASDANNGGAPGTVRDKVNNQMAGHRRRAERLLAD